MNFGKFIKIYLFAVRKQNVRGDEPVTFSEVLKFSRLDKKINILVTLRVESISLIDPHEQYLAEKVALQGFICNMYIFCIADMSNP